jgi:hypothetical protein
MGANDNVVVSIVGDASGVAPAINQTQTELGALQPILAELNTQIAALSAEMRAGFGAGAASAHKLAAGLNEAKVASHGVGTGMQGMIGKIHEGAEGIRTFQMRAKAFAEVYVAMFAVDRIAEFISKMGEASERVQHLSQQFGMTTGEVQKLQGVATATGIPIEALTKGLGFLDRNMANAAGGSKTLQSTMRQVGVSFNDGRSQMEKLAVVADKFKNMDDGPKKVALAMALFGRSGRELIPILNLGSQGIEQLNKKMEEYGVQNDDAIAKGVALAESVNETKLGFMGVSNVMTAALAPVFKILVDDLNQLIVAFIKSYKEGGIVALIFTAITNVIQEVIAVVEALAEIFSAIWDVISEIMSDIGSIFEDIFGVKVPGYIDYSKVALNEFKDVITIVKDAIIISLAIIGGAFRVAMQIVVTFGKIAWDALHLDWGAIQADWSAGMGKIDSIVAQEAKRVKQYAAEMGAAIKAAAHGEALGGDKKTGLEMPKAGGDFSYTPGGGGSKKKKEGMSLAERLEAELEAKKLAWAMEQDAQGTFQQYSLQSEADFWAAALQRHGLSVKDKLAIEKKYLAARSALKKEEIGTQLDGYAAEIELAGANADKKLAILREEQAFVAHMYGAESKEARRATEDVLKAEREKQAQLRELEGAISKGREDAAMAGVDAEEAAAEFEVEIGRRTAGQLIAQQRLFENQRFQIQRQGVLERLRLAQLDPMSSPAKLKEIQSQIEALERTHQAKLTQIDRQAQLQRTQMARQAFTQIGQSFGDHISKMVTLQEGWREGLIGIYQGLVQTVADVLAQIIAKWVAAFLIKLILGKQEAASTVATHVGEAGAGGVASMAAAPFPINLTAPAFGASMAAAAAAFGSVAAAEGGDWNVREGMYHLHEQEMVLPAWAAKPLRNMLSGGGEAIPGSPLAAHRQDATRSALSQENNFHFAPTLHGAPSMSEMLRKSGREFRRWMENQARNGALALPAS